MHALKVFYEHMNELMGRRPTCRMSLYVRALYVVTASLPRSLKVTHLGTNNTNLAYTILHNFRVTTAYSNYRYSF